MIAAAVVLLVTALDVSRMNEFLQRRSGAISTFSPRVHFRNTSVKPQDPAKTNVTPQDPGNTTVRARVEPSRKAPILPGDLAPEPISTSPARAGVHSANTSISTQELASTSLSAPVDSWRKGPIMPGASPPVTISSELHNPPAVAPFVLSAKAGEAPLSSSSQINFDPRYALPVVVTEGQAPLSVGYQKHAEIALTGATAAYSLDPSIADASAENGLVQITGKSPGATNVVIVTQSGVRTLTVNVPVPPPVLPPGFEGASRSEAGETGIYEFRYNSDPGQITNSLAVRRTQGRSFDRMQIVNANLFSAGSSVSAVGFPLLSYEISRPNRDYTFIDEMVSNSPLTVDGYMVRGMHVREGDWQFHGGFTSIATFQGLFLATDREYVGGISRDFKLDGNNSLQANLFYFRNPESQQTAASNGAVGTFAYRYALKDKARLITEWGFGRGLAFAARGGFDNDKDHLAGALRITSSHFASLAVNTQRGTFADLNASHTFNERLYGSFSLNESNFSLPVLKQNTFTSSALLNLKLNRNFSLSSGGAFSRFKSVEPAGTTLTSVNLPAGIDFSSRHFGSGLQYQRTINLDGSGGNDYNTNVRGSFGQFHSSAFFRHDVQVPTVSAIFSQVPGLQDALLRAGINATTPDQIADLLRNTALLESLGFTNLLAVDLAPARNDYGASLTWMGRGVQRRQADFTYFKSNTELLQGRLTLATATLSYAQRITTNDNIVGSAALVETVSNGSTDRHPLFSISLQHRFYNFPSFIMPGGRHGVIQGHVFRDDDSMALFKGQPALAGVEVRLDDERVTHSDASGFYSFHHVPYGVHRVEAKLESEDPFFYTTDSPATTDINNTVDFGINFAKGQVFGFVLNDAGAGVGGIGVELHGEKFTRRVQTGSNGKFTFPGLPAGNYTVATVPDSYPAGYSLQTLAPEEVTVDPGKPASVRFTVKAIRSIAGKVLVYDSALLKAVPLAGVSVRLKELSLEAKTAENGAFIFRSLPSGDYTLVVEYRGKQVTHTILLPAEPASVRDIELNAGTK